MLYNFIRRPELLNDRAEPYSNSQDFFLPWKQRITPGFKKWVPKMIFSMTV